MNFDMQLEIIGMDDLSPTSGRRCIRAVKLSSASLSGNPQSIPALSSTSEGLPFWQLLERVSTLCKYASPAIGTIEHWLQAQAINRAEVGDNLPRAS